MKTINELKLEISTLREQILPTQKQIQKLQDEVDSMEKQIEETILKDNQYTVDLFENLGAEYIFAEEDADDTAIRVSEDDGTLHVQMGKVRGCFICNQEITRSEWNKEAKEVLKKLGIPFSRLNK